MFRLLFPKSTGRSTAVVTPTGTLSATTNHQRAYQNNQNNNYNNNNNNNNNNNGNNNPSSSATTETCLEDQPPPTITTITTRAAATTTNNAAPSTPSFWQRKPRKTSHDSQISTTSTIGSSCSVSPIRARSSLDYNNNNYNNNYNNSTTGMGTSGNGISNNHSNTTTATTTMFTTFESLDDHQNHNLLIVDDDVDDGTIPDGTTTTTNVTTTTTQRVRLNSRDIPRTYSGLYGTSSIVDGDLISFELNRRPSRRFSGFTYWILLALYGTLLFVVQILVMICYVPTNHMLTYSWTWTNVLHCLCTILLVHWKKGSIYYMDDSTGELNSLTVWEQLDATQDTRVVRETLMVIPCILTWIACHVVDYDKLICMINICCWMICMLGKLPCMNGVRLFGINQTAGIDDMKHIHIQHDPQQQQTTTQTTITTTGETKNNLNKSNNNKNNNNGSSPQPVVTTIMERGTKQQQQQENVIAGSGGDNNNNNNTMMDPPTMRRRRGMSSNNNNNSNTLLSSSSTTAGAGTPTTTTMGMFKKTR